MQDSTTITSEKLYYDGNGRTAKLRGNVVYVDDTIRLFTDNLDYDLINKSATYFGGGKIVDGVNTMTSLKGDYDKVSNIFIFNDSVKLITPDYTLESNDLVYNIVTKKARISTKSKIVTTDGIILHAEEGSEFDTTEGTYAFQAGKIDTEKYIIEGRRLFYNQKLGSYSAIGNVKLFAKEDDIIITGDEANYWEDKGIAEVYGEPLLKRVMAEDTLYLRADTLVSIDDSLEVNKRLLAFHNVKIFKSDLQGKADSLAYFLSDSSIIFYQDPILWNDGSQITADTIQILVKNGSIDQLFAKVNSFIISEDSTSNYNQIKGRMMTAFFDGKSIKNVDVTGNGETIYWVADEENTSKVVGMNKIICTNMKIGFVDNQVDDIRIYITPDGDFIPPHELKDDQKLLDGFAWRVEERPTFRSIIIAPSEAERLRKKAEEIYQEELLDQSQQTEQLLKENKEIKSVQDKLQNTENQKLQQQ